MVSRVSLLLGMIPARWEVRLRRRAMSLLSWNTGSGWSADFVVPGASEDGYQGRAGLALDPHGDLHLVWVDRGDLGSPTRLKYIHGRAQLP